LSDSIETDGVHYADGIGRGKNTPETLSEAVKILKGDYCIRAIKEHKMDNGIIFCRAQCYKTFSTVFYYVFIPGKLLQLSVIMFFVTAKSPL